MDIHSRPSTGTSIGVIMPVSPTTAGPCAVQVGLPSSGERGYPTLADLSHSPPPALASVLPKDTKEHDETSTAEDNPNLSAQMSQVRTVSHDAPASSSPLRVLYVEDNRINALLFEEALRPYPQIDLEIAEDGQMALSLAGQTAPDVLVLDAHLPGMSGFEVLKALRQLPKVADVPAFMCSADAMPEDVARAKAAGFTGYWTKPIDILAVTEELCRLAADSSKRRDNPAP
jgi:CheY-like chemotaxis protein